MAQCSEAMISPEPFDSLYTAEWIAQVSELLMPSAGSSFWLRPQMATASPSPLSLFCMKPLMQTGWELPMPLADPRT